VIWAQDTRKKGDRDKIQGHEAALAHAVQNGSVIKANQLTPQLRGCRPRIPAAMTADTSALLLRIELADMAPKNIKARAWSALQVRQVLAEMERPHFDLGGRTPRIPPPGFRKLKPIPFTALTRLKG
jgi:hypothetical protein